MSTRIAAAVAIRGMSSDESRASANLRSPRVSRSAARRFDRITSQTHRSVEVLAADLNDKADLARVEDKLRSDASITLLVNNAGIAAVTPLAASDVERLESMIDLNVTALMRLTAAVVPSFVARSNGAISAVALGPEPEPIAVASDPALGVPACAVAAIEALPLELVEEQEGVD